MGQPNLHLLPVTALLSIIALGGTFTQASSSSSSSSSSSYTGTGTHNSISQCLSLAGVPALTPSSPSWATTILPFNLRLPYQPISVAQPTTPKQVSAALKCARQHGVKVQARSGGHSYGSMGLGGKDGSLVVDMGKFNEVVVDKKTQVARVGAGVRLGNLALGLWEQGGRAVPHGLCPGVGLGGHATHGGFGFTSRMWGITLDKIVKLDVVLANGTITVATSTKNPELFWALRGAGSSFAIVTTFHLQTLPAPPTSLQFNLNLPPASFSTPALRASIFLSMQSYALTAPPELALRLLTAPSESVRRLLGIDLPGGAILISGAYWGTKSEFDKVIAPLVGMLPNGTTVDTVQGAYLDTLLGVSGETTLKVPLEGYSAHDTFFVKSVVTPQERLLDEKALVAYFEYLMTVGESMKHYAWWVIADLYGGDHSVINQPHLLSSSSYAHRASMFTFQLYSDTWSHNLTSDPYPSEGIPFMTGMAAALTGGMEERDVKGYVNYVDPTLSAAEAGEFYYGDEVWDGGKRGEGRLERLRRIKRRWDGEGVLWNPQAIGA